MYAEFIFFNFASKYHPWLSRTNMWIINLVYITCSFYVQVQRVCLHLVIFKIVWTDIYLLPFVWRFFFLSLFNVHSSSLGVDLSRDLSSCQVSSVLTWDDYFYMNYSFVFNSSFFLEKPIIHWALASAIAIRKKLRAFLIFGSSLIIGLGIWIVISQGFSFLLEWYIGPVCYKLKKSGYVANCFWKIFKKLIFVFLQS